MHEMKKHSLLFVALNKLFFVVFKGKKKKTHLMAHTVTYFLLAVGGLRVYVRLRVCEVGSAGSASCVTVCLNCAVVC